MLQLLPKNVMWCQQNEIIIHVYQLDWSLYVDNSGFPLEEVFDNVLLDLISFSLMLLILQEVAA